jgi:hypothetical protein
MPFWKTSNQKRKILANTSLIACRGIGSILMYELERNTSFLPNVYFIVSADEYSIKASSLVEHGSMINELGLEGKANCFNLDLMTMKKYQVPIFPQSFTSLEHTAGTGTMMPRSYDQQLMFANNATAEMKSQEPVENDQHNNKGTHRDIKQQRQESRGLYLQETGMNVLVEVFESHRMLLVDDHNGL